jgi:hypothetical protein
MVEGVHRRLPSPALRLAARRSLLHIVCSRTASHCPCCLSWYSVKSYTTPCLVEQCLECTVRNLMHRNPRSIFGSRLAALLWYRFFKEVRLHFDNVGAFNVYIATLSPLPLYCCAVSRNSHTSLQHTPTLPDSFPKPTNQFPDNCTYYWTHPLPPDIGSATRAHIWSRPPSDTTTRKHQSQ